MFVRLPTNDANAMRAWMAFIQEAPMPISKTMKWPTPGQEGPVEVFEGRGGVFSYPFVAHQICQWPCIKYACVRKLTDANGKPLGTEARQKVEKFVQEFWARPYESGKAGMLELAGPIFHLNPRVDKKCDKGNVGG
jgi:hypothetical protein